MRVAGGQRPPGEQEQELAQWLGDREQLRGRVQLVQSGRQTGGLSESIASVVIEVGPVAAAFASALVAWIRHRTADTRVTVRRPDGTKFDISAQRVRGLGAAELSALVEQVAGAVATNPVDPNKE
jgi:hypothetical protein